MNKELIMAKQQRTIGVFVIQLALAVYFIVTSLCMFGLGSSISEGEVVGVTKLFGDAGKILQIAIGVLLMVCGVCFFIKAIGIDLGKFDDVIFNKGNGWLHWCLALAKNCLIVGGILTVKNGR